MLKEVRDLHRGFQIVLGFLFAATFAATVNLQGNFTDVDTTSYAHLSYWESASATGYGYLAFFSQDNATCMPIRDACWQTYQMRSTNATAWESRQDCSSCSQWTDSNELSSVKNFIEAPYTQQHTVFLQWLGATLALTAMALLIGSILHVLPLRPLFVALLCVRLVVVSTAFAMVSAIHTARQAVFINYAHDQGYRAATMPGVTAVFSLVWVLAIVLIVYILVWDPRPHVKPCKESSQQTPSVAHNRGP